jgi:sugar phosphate isomerase/epimerase
MKIAISTRIAKEFWEFLKALPRFNFKLIELHYSTIDREKLEMLERFRPKLGIASIYADPVNYVYHLFLAQSLACEFVSFAPPKEKQVEKFKRIIERAKELGVSVAIENSAGLTIERFLSLREKLGKEVGVLLNIANIYSTTRDVFSYIKRVKESVAGIRVSDYYRGYPNLPLGLGDVDLRAIWLSLKDLNVPWMIDLAEEYSILDAWISKERLEKATKAIK